MSKSKPDEDHGLVRAGETTKQPPPNKKLSVAVLPKETKGAKTLAKLEPSAFQNRQLNLFQDFLCNTDDQRDQLSNAIDLWDNVPRYSISRQAMTKARIGERFLEKHEMTFQHRGRTYTRVMYPASVDRP